MATTKKKIEVLGENPIQVKLHTPQIPNAQGVCDIANSRIIHSYDRSTAPSTASSPNGAI